MSDADDYDLILFLSSSGPCSLNKKPGKNWVERAGGLPNYICHIAKAVGKHGHSTSGSIAIAIGTVKRWAAGGGKVNADTRAKAARALAQWEALKAKAHAGHLVKASNAWGEDYITLAAADSYNMDAVRDAYERLQTMSQMHAKDAGTQKATYSEETEGPRTWSWIREIWNDFVIVQVNGPDDLDYYKIPYTVSGGEVDFGTPKRVVQAWDEQADDDLNDAELAMLEEELKGQSPSDEIRLTKIMKVRTVEGQKRFNAPIGATIQADGTPQEGTPSTVIRLISLYRAYKQAKGSGNDAAAQAAMKHLNEALDKFPETEDNKQALAKIRRLVSA